MFITFIANLFKFLFKSSSNWGHDVKLREIPAQKGIYSDMSIWIILWLKHTYMTRMPDQTENMHHSRMKEIPDIHLNSKIHKSIASTSYYPIILQACSIMILKVKTCMCIWGDYYTHVTYVHLLTILITRIHYNLSLNLFTIP